MSESSHNRSERQSIFQRFVHSEVSGSILLLLCTVVALFWANSAWSESYFDLIEKYIGVAWGDAAFKLSLQHWVNDVLMAVFFFVVGLEIKREIVVGQLSSLSRSVLPVSAALGGMLVPAAFYFVVNTSGPGVSGWGIPMATDIAFALGILALFGRRVPTGLKVFLTALAIADDLGAVLVIAIFYSGTINLIALGVAGVLLAAIGAANRAGVTRSGLYIVLAIGVWLAVFSSGVHATVAGILVAMLVPVKARIDPSEFLVRARSRLEELDAAELTRESMLHDRAQLEALDDMYLAAGKMIPAGVALEEALHPVVVFLILPLFALFNAGVTIDAGVATLPPAPVTLGVVLGLFLGKQLGIWLFSWMAIKSGWARMPEGVTWPMIYGAGLLAGVGFTMSLFVSDLAFDAAELLNEAKIGILAGSLLSGAAGYLTLSRVLRERRAG
ncbi:MAG: Na+/H+ antiporter NhaA [Gemmatimonadetes bacterium]|uniref:Na(+)/H(+) antiporter NhaA n=1 Tax=Candidatus Kutchimonas denitrificans TaxID=3056748 RepID=A0AAE5CCS5_9BACT|nr:Na+/H+ antiporter NhaA [Gemmatimonadota bacterium]NIR74594.1 Na+/H+ antiporter NhaA [Candidatus Kutchimonas denitrificans]NIS02784.1 Na+/H+ antiporter NhaA [Gemmatimonadota bacterium]NIT68945.1 Na+/H+ antiporter NhaA [Gemmatimonadota bacterium]NIU52250.1 Na+/H+ antiporter NhaA [Gemmatimonadota bacterium]